MKTPESATESFLKAFNSGNIDAILSHYAPGGVFVNQDGTTVQGKKFRETLAEFLAMKPQLQVNKAATITAGDTATNMGKWTLKGTGPDGSEVVMEGSGFDVMQRQSDGSWKMVIDNPWGTAVLG
ncbi:MAG TPA: DUF4440 domain-containing protein [Bryobacterales bacterium]|nr:DUF4440 domain-containing protein [Bryobacterales bacterium]